MSEGNAKFPTSPLIAIACCGVIEGMAGGATVAKLDENDPAKDCIPPVKALDKDIPRFPIVEATPVTAFNMLPPDPTCEANPDKLAAACFTLAVADVTVEFMVFVI